MKFLSIVVSTRMRALFTASVIGVTVSDASAQITMVYDTFTGANGTSLATHTPDTDLPLTNWTIRTNGTLVLNGNAALSTQGDGWSWPPWAAIESNTTGRLRSTGHQALACPMVRGPA